MQFYHYNDLAILKLHHVHQDCMKVPTTMEDIIIISLKDRPYILSKKKPTFKFFRRPAREPDGFVARQMDEHTHHYTDLQCTFFQASICGN